jgi:hypothetical protein
MGKLVAAPGYLIVAPVITPDPEAFTDLGAAVPAPATPAGAQTSPLVLYFGQKDETPDEEYFAEGFVLSVNAKNTIWDDQIEVGSKAVYVARHGYKHGENLILSLTSIVAWEEVD